MNLWRINKLYFIRLKRLKGSPRDLALGIALGVFIGITPTIPFHTGLIIVCALATRSSALAGIITSWIVCNPLTAFPLYYIATVIGNMVTPYKLNIETVHRVLDTILSSDSFKNTLSILFDMGYEAFIVLGVGSVIIALPSAVISYFVAFNFFNYVKEKKRMKKHRT